MYSQVRIHGVYVLTGLTCSAKPVYRQRSSSDALYLHSPGHEHQWNIGPIACMASPRHKWMERYSFAETAEALGNGTWFETSASSTWVKNSRVAVAACPPEVAATVRARRGLKSGIACVVVTGSTQDGVFLQDGTCNGKPSYTRVYVREGKEPAPASLYSPSRRNSWLIGTDPCRANGWVEVRSAAERAEYLQAEASGPWQEFNGTSWARSPGIRALTHCGSLTAGCVYISGSRHQQHTHGLYSPTGLTCSGKPVYVQQAGDSANSPPGAPAASGAEGSISVEPGLYLYAPAGRESWMVGREACKPSGWLEVHSNAPFVEAISGTWREHVPGGTWGSNPSIRLQLHPLQDVFSGFAFADGRASLRDPHLVLWRLSALLSADLAPPTDAERALIDDAVAAQQRRATGGSVAQRLRRLRGVRSVGGGGVGGGGGGGEGSGEERHGGGGGGNGGDSEGGIGGGGGVDKGEANADDGREGASGGEGGSESRGASAGALAAGVLPARGPPSSSRDTGGGDTAVEDTTGGLRSSSSDTAGELRSRDTAGVALRKYTAGGLRSASSRDRDDTVGGARPIRHTEGGWRPAPPPSFLRESEADSSLCVDLLVEPSLEGGRLLILERTPSPAR